MGVEMRASAELDLSGVDCQGAEKPALFYFLGGDSLHAGIYTALVLACSKRGIRTTLILPHRIPLRRVFSFFVAPRFVGPNPVSDLRRRLGGNLIIVPYLEIPKVADSVFAGLVALVIFARIGFSKRAVIHSKLMNECVLVVKKLLGRTRASIICEVEGDFESEILYAQAKGALVWDAETLQQAVQEATRKEAAIVQNADALVFVTRKLKEVVLNRQHVLSTYKGATAVYPTRASSELFYFDPAERKRVRSQLGLGNAVIILYSGNLNGVWQIPDRITSLFGIIEKEIPGAHLVVLTKRGDERYILPSLREYGIKQYMILHPQHTEIRGYLCAADCGLMLRERHLMNEVASPGKFCEYVLCGLPLIMTKGIGEYSRMMGNTRYVLSLDSVDWNADNHKLITDFIRKRISSIERSEYAVWSAKEFSIEQNHDELLALYKAASEARAYSPITSERTLETGD
jgi:hypothetical protein